LCCCTSHFFVDYIQSFHLSVCLSETFWRQFVYYISFPFLSFNSFLFSSFLFFPFLISVCLYLLEQSQKSLFSVLAGLIIVVSYHQQMVRPSRSSDDHVKWRPRLSTLHYIAPEGRKKNPHHCSTKSRARSPRCVSPSLLT